MSVTDYEPTDIYGTMNNLGQPNLMNSRSDINLAASPSVIKSETPSISGEQVQPHTKSSKKAVSSFISKLYNMVENGRHENLISWNTNGTSFFVYNAVQFSQEVLPDFFKHSNFSSFVRLLNMYNFHKINKSPRGQRGINENEVWEFSHPKFRHGHPELLKEIKRKAMDSELLRKEAGDIHASFAKLQMSQADLLQQFHVLQDNFSSLLQGFEQTKRIQQQQQSIIQQLAEKQGLKPLDLLPEDSVNNNINFNSISPSAVKNPATVYVGADANNPYGPLQFVQYDNSWDQRSAPSPVQSNSEVGSSLYDSTKLMNSGHFSPQFFDSAINTPLPPSPMPNSIVGSPVLSLTDLKFDDVNSLGISYQT
ncbi:HSF-type DNA-binding-domain-containing protein [Pilobolus umbonatus]|nr:HSF-type DNA-binding-domain-containing protein [Pilobolus umbonatus]